jgi:hypothetical protein
LGQMNTNQLTDSTVAGYSLVAFLDLRLYGHLKKRSFVDIMMINYQLFLPRMEGLAVLDDLAVLNYGGFCLGATDEIVWKAYPTSQCISA